MRQFFLILVGALILVSCASGPSLTSEISSFRVGSKADLQELRNRLERAAEEGTDWSEVYPLHALLDSSSFTRKYDEFEEEYNALILYLLEQGVDINGPITEELPHYTLQEEYTPLHVLMRQYPGKNQLTAARFLVEKGADPQPAAGPPLMNLLFSHNRISCAEEMAETARFFAERGANFNGAEGWDRNKTALHNLMAGFHFVEDNVAYGDKYKKYRSDIAALVGVAVQNTEDVNSRDQFGLTPLHYLLDSAVKYRSETENAATKAAISVLEVQAAAGVEAYDIEGPDSYSLVVQDALLLLLQAGGDLQARDQWGLKPFDYMGSEEISKNIAATF